MMIKIKPRALLVLFSLVAVFSMPASAEGPKISWELDDALKQINRQADNFDSALSRVEIVRTDANDEEVERQSGTIFFDRSGKIRIDMDTPNQRTFLLEKKTLYIHYPSEQRVEQYSLSRHKDRLEPFLRLGFSLTGKDLKDDYLLTSMGERDIGTSRSLGLDLTPERDKTRAIMGGAQLWIDQASWMPTQQVIAATSTGETLTVTYTHTARNLKLNPDLFKAKWPRGTDKKKM